MLSSLSEFEELCKTGDLEQIKEYNDKEFYNKDYLAKEELNGCKIHDHEDNICGDDLDNRYDHDHNKCYQYYECYVHVMHRHYI